ncbi:MAG: pentapeptide repeat-containing protein [Roseomonas sp.]|nr:pentapeptide repeat-containing protein [Roseomonas sp.]MCA3329059.1 pentapeptide repeat-containing protein [Roseomonas sp.]MCA3330654.1 pentapeptide repeat-containing protein [Roseomonas sp.]MCA3334143.1 pentapeptide repeat-containing protein [Roseomonas sp.]MCA3348807.1 pentapeptide repeat-containing protein [Roseomonas sp.]
MSAFDPPPYIGKLISAINDGAKSAQLGAVAFVFIGLFLLATSFSATDEDLLIGKSISISQLGGVTVPVVLSFGFMPAIFLALHLYTLIRFDLLMQNLRHFEAELRAHVPLQRDRDRCLQLLANTEFIQAAVQPEASFVFRWTYRFMLAVFPVAVLLLVQLGSLRLQSHVVNIVHHITILLDILLLIWFFRRQRPSGDSVMRWLFRRGRFLLPAAVLAFNFAWCRVPSAEATTVGAGKQAESFLEVSLQPVDLLLCHHVGFGCRYLSVPGRTLVGKVWDNRTFVELRAGKPLDEDRRAAFEPLVLQNKRLRFADLSGSQFFNVDLTGADLRHARLHQAWMTQAKLDGAQLQGASLAAAQLQGASLDFAQLQGALLNGAYLQGASLRLAELQDARLVEAKLQGASLDGAQLQGASLDRAQLQGASLDVAFLQGASLDGAYLQGARLNLAQLQGASLDRAQLQGASLDEAQLQGAWLDGAGLQGALIAGAKIWRIRAPEAALDDAQLRDLEFSDAAPCPDWVQPDEACPNPRDWRSWIEEWTKSIPAGSRRDAAQRRLAVLTAVSAPAGAETAQGVWNTRPTPEPEAVAKRLGDLACGTDHAPHIARGILVQIRQEEPRNLGAHRQTLAARMLGDDCPGARGLTEDERSHLTNIAAGRR